MHLPYDNFHYDRGLLRFAKYSIMPLCFDYISASSSVNYDSGCASYAKQTNTSSGSSTPGGGKPVDPPKGTGQSGGHA
ncbi:hypothetical protein EDD85DRAFT_961299 [Armillaria nabsnona]|nr:hypothetical protein EDD85DRAFT_961299 [Armillaria nabsnona]